MKSMVVLILLFSLALSGVVFAHGAHVHSVSSGTLAIDQNQIEFSLQSPGANLVGFEHPPRDEAQAATLEQAKAALQSGDWLRFAPDADCAIVELQLETPGFQQTHSHDHEHEEHHEHAEFHLLARAECGNIEQLDWMEFDVFEDWPDHREMQLDVLTDRIQQRYELNADMLRVDLD